MSGIISYWSRPELADVEVVICEVIQDAPANAGHKRDREEQLALPALRWQPLGFLSQNLSY
jgi:hypothetical protein